MTERLAGRYEIHGEIAAGGMATVHLGRDVEGPGPGRTVAVKRLHAQFAKDPEFSGMLLDEARLTSRISHPNVVATLDAVAQNGELFVVMEYVRGETLSRLLGAARKRNEVIPPRIAAAIVHGVLQGLHAAHEAVSEAGEPLHIVHRDVSPQNILVGADGIAKVLDFGVAKAKGRSRTTRDGQIRGKLGYMAPEQLHGEPVTRRTDVYAAAIVLWEGLTATRLFDGDTEAEVIGKVARAVAPPPSSQAAGVPAGLDAVTLRGLVRNPKWRYATARAMAEALEGVIDLATPAEIGAWVELVAGDVLRDRAAVEVSLPAASPTRRARRRGLGFGLAAFGIASAAAIVGVRLRRADGLAPDVRAMTETSLAQAAGPPDAGAAVESTAPAASSENAPPVASGAPVTSTVPTDVADASTDSTARKPNKWRKPGKACDPPFTVDSAGRRHFKVECL